MDMKELEDDFPLTRRFNYLNTAAVGLTPRSVIQKINTYNQGCLHHPPYEELFDKAQAIVEEVRRRFAKFINASPDEVSFQSNTSTGINLVAHIIDWKRGDDVILDDLLFPSDVYPWLMLRKRGVEVRMLRNVGGRVGVEQYEEAVDDRTRLVMLSHVSFANGFRCDVEAISKVAGKKNAYCLVDATQSAGFLDIDMRRWNVDFLVTSNYKWLLAPFGAAEFYCSKRVMDEFESPVSGWHSAEKPMELRIDEYEEAEGARRFEPGNPDYMAIYGLGECLFYIRSLSASRIKAHVDRLYNALVEGLGSVDARIHTPTDKESRSAIIFCSFVGKDGLELSKALEAQKIIVAGRKFGDFSGLRVAPYFYNTEEDVEAFIKAVKALMG